MEARLISRAKYEIISIKILNEIIIIKNVCIEELHERVAFDHAVQSTFTSEKYSAGNGNDIASEAVCERRNSQHDFRVRAEVVGQDQCDSRTPQ